MVLVVGSCVEALQDVVPVEYVMSYSQICADDTEIVPTTGVGVGVGFGLGELASLVADGVAVTGPVVGAGAEVAGEAAAGEGMAAVVAGDAVGDVVGDVVADAVALAVAGAGAAGATVAGGAQFIVGRPATDASVVTSLPRTHQRSPDRSGLRISSQPSWAPLTPTTNTRSPLRSSLTTGPPGQE